MEELNYILNGVAQTAKPGMTILEAAREAGVNIPTLCFLKDCNEIGACRVCLVEIKGKSSLMPACVAKVTEGMEIVTESPEIDEARKESLERICAEHFFECDFCPRYCDCELYMLMIKYGVDENKLKYAKTLTVEAPDTSAEHLVCDPSKCIECRRCVSVCKDGLGDEGNAIIQDKEKSYPARAAALEETVGFHNGQCITVCPTGALSERNETRWAFNAIKAKDTYTVAIVSPYSAVAFGETLHFPMGEADGMGKLVGALRDIGFDAVFDGSIGINMAAQKLAQELRTANKPVISGACAAFSRMCAAKYPEFVAPQSIMADFAEVCRETVKEAAQGKKIHVIAIEPCTAEKHKEYTGSLDGVLTTNELSSMWKKACVSRFTARDLWKTMEPSAPDAIPGAPEGDCALMTYGGILELALKQLSGGTVSFNAVDEDGVSEAVYETEGGTKRAVLVIGLGKAQKLMEKLSKGEVTYDSVEVIGCPGGCIVGGGQPRRYSETYSYLGVPAREAALTQ